MITVEDLEYLLRQYKLKHTGIYILPVDIIIKLTKPSYGNICDLVETLDELGYENFEIGPWLKNGKQLKTVSYLIFNKV